MRKTASDVIRTCSQRICPRGTNVRSTCVHATSALICCQWCCDVWRAVHVCQDYINRASLLSTFFQTATNLTAIKCHPSACPIYPSARHNSLWIFNVIEGELFSSIVSHCLILLDRFFSIVSFAFWDLYCNDRCTRNGCFRPRCDYGVSTHLIPSYCTMGGDNMCMTCVCFHSDLCIA